MNLAALAAMCCLGWGFPVLAQGAEAPVFGSTVAYGVTQSDATLEAWIDPGTLPEGAYYQFQVVANPSEYPSELLCPEHAVPLSKPDGCGGPDSGPTTPGALPIGYIEKEPESRYARIDLVAAGMTLKPGTTYHYRVVAAKRVQSEDTLNWQGPPAVSSDQTFTTLTPGTPPTIEGESASNIASTDATLEATIKPEDLATTYEFYLEAPSCANDKQVEACEASGGIPIAKGSIPAGSGAQTVSVDIAAAAGHSLTSGTIEGYRVVASNSAGTSYGGEKTFTTLPPGAPPNEVVTEPAEPTSAGFKLKGKLNPSGLPTTYYFHYWQVKTCSEDPPDCGLNTAVVGPITGDTQQEVPPIEVTGLTTGEKYGYELIATNAGGTVRSTKESTFIVQPTGAPSEVLTESAEATAAGFRLKGEFNPNGLPTTYYYEYASDTCDEGCTPTRTAVVGPLTGNAQEEVPAVEVTGLTAGDTYWYRLVASNADGSEDGTTLTLKVPSGSPTNGETKQQAVAEPPMLLVPPVIVTTPSKPKSLTNTKKLAVALKLCERKPKKRQASCKRQARRKYRLVVGKTPVRQG
jgi:hypothetical protein